MRTRIFIAIAALLVAVSVAQAQKINVDIDKTADFSALRSFGWAGGQIAPKETTSQMIVTAIESELKARGLVRNDTNPDIQIAVMAAAGMELQGVGPSWNREVYKSWGGYGNPNALMTVTNGTLLIDLIETKKKNSIWRGVAEKVFIAQPTGNLTRDAKEMEGVVNKTVSKMFKKYPVKPKR